MTCKPTTLGSRYANTILQTGVAPSFDMIGVVNSQANPSDNYDKQKLLNISKSLNVGLARADTSSFPLLDSRYRQMPILYPEVADFLDQTGLNIDQVEESLSHFDKAIALSPVFSNLGDNTIPLPSVPTDVQQIYNQLEFYYSDNMANSISGGMCSAIANPFGKLLAALELLKFTGDLINKILDFDLNALLAPLNALKDKLISIVDSLKETLIKQVEGIVKSATAFINNVKAGAQSIVNKLKKMVDNVKSFFSDTTTGKLKDQIKGFVQKAIDQFKKLDGESIALLLFRFCQFSEMIQAFMKGPVDGLKAFVVNLTLQEQLINKMSSFRTQAAANAGAVRLTDSGIKAAVNRLVHGTNRTATERDSMSQREANPRGYPEPEYYVSTNFLTATERESLINLTEDGIDGYFKFASSVKNMGEDVVDAVKGDGFRKLEPELLAKFTRVCRRLDKTLTINSGFRSPLYNAKVGGSSGSMHMSGFAIDVSLSGLSNDDVKNLIRIASQEGFTGIAVYNSFIHLDIGGRRTWDTGNTKYASFIDLHLRDGYRRGATTNDQYAGVTTSGVPV